jgi:hypothetical protein
MGKAVQKHFFRTALSSCIVEFVPGIINWIIIRIIKIFAWFLSA